MPRPRPLLLALLLLAPVAHAEPEPDPAVLALFRQGRALIAQGHWTEGCAKIAQSYERERHASALLNLARCDEHAGRLASAWSRTHEAMPLVDRIADPVRRAELREAARTSLAALERRLPRLRIVTSEPILGLRATDDLGRSIPLDEALPFDPGPQRVRVAAPGRKEASYEVTLVEGQTATLAVALERELVSPALAPALAPVSPAPLAPPPAKPSLAPPSSSSSPWPYVTGLSAAALAGVAIGFGVDAAQANASIRARCGADLVCDEDPSFDPGPANDRKNLGLAVAIGAGAGAVVTGALTWFLFDRRRAPTAASLLGPTRF